MGVEGVVGGGADRQRQTDTKRELKLKKFILQGSVKNLSNTVTTSPC